MGVADTAPPVGRIGTQDRAAGAPSASASPATKGAPALILEAVVKRYSKDVVVGPVSLSVAAGEFLSLLGPSGCGKTTLLRSIAGFETVASGKILVGGRDITFLPAHRRGVGLVFQNYALFPHLSIFDNIAFGLRLRKWRPDAIAQKVAGALEMVGLAGVEKRTPGELSGGQQQRVAIARSLVLEPELLLLDEPLSNLDFKLRVQMRYELRQIQRRAGMTFVYVTHDQTEALSLSDRIIVLSNGRIAQEGTPAEIYGAPRTRFVADFIGTTNMLPATIERLNGDGTLVARMADGPSFTGHSRAARRIGEAVSVCIRPECVALAPGDEADSNILSGRVVSETFCGDRTEVRVEIGEGQGRQIVVYYQTGRQPVPPAPRLACAIADTVILGDE
ncbi:MAG: ABC transporter ATP-binding protein [Alphaproteobacteria bacterium]|nr:ABC transporter ATP-binding protein [Alphaproteobacteria bacterium]